MPLENPEQQTSRKAGDRIVLKAGFSEACLSPRALARNGYVYGAAVEIAEIVPADKAEQSYMAKMPNGALMHIYERDICQTRTGASPACEF